MNLFEVPASEETFNIQLKELHQDQNRGSFLLQIPESATQTFLCVTLCVSVEVLGQTPAGSSPGRDSNEKLFTMTPNTWHIQV